MGSIRILDRRVVEQIAAGEVIDRPASILKELLENSLDAGSTRIETDIVGGGVEKLVIADNGCGMDEGDAALSLQRHATSKISALEDLDALRTFGFRGEALASVAAVSRLDLLTRPQKDTHGTKIFAEGGMIQNIGPGGSPPGTHLVVRDLFFNVPARRKFLKSNQTEESACMDIVGKIALSRLDVTFQIKKNGKIITTLSSGETLKERYLKLFPQTPEHQLFSIESVRDSMKLAGLIGAPLFCKSSRNSILFFVNQRSVRPGVLSQAVVDGYSGYLQAGKFPIAILFLEMDGRLVDVNVHPTKAEVKFSHSKEVYGFLEKAISERLRESQESVRRHVMPDYAPMVSEARGYVPQHYDDLTLFEKVAPYEAKVSTPRVLGYMAKTYGLFQEDSTLFLVDMHNAHERVNFDMLESRMGNGHRPSQELLAPVPFELSADQHLLISKYGNFFKEMGLEIEEFGGQTMLLRAVPLGLQQLGQKRFLLSLMEKLTNIDELKDPAAIQRKILMTMACRSSIQAGDDVSVTEMQSLFEKLLRSSNPYFCPHGRPIIVKLTLDEVHRLFRRK